MLDSHLSRMLERRRFTLGTMETTLAERVQEVVTYLKEQQGMTVAHIAGACDVKVQAVYQWLNGETKSLDGANLAELAELSGYSPLWISKEKGEKRRAYARNQRQARILTAMSKMPEETEIKLVKIGDTLAEPDGKNGPSSAAQ